MQSTGIAKYILRFVHSLTWWCIIVGATGRSKGNRVAKGVESSSAMAWRCGGRTNRELVANLANSKIVTNKLTEAAMLGTDRKMYVPKQFEKNAYDDNPLPLGLGATISAPHMHAYALDWLAPVITETSNILDVGSGSGYLTACFARMAEGGQAFGIDHIDTLVQSSIENVKRDDASLLDSGRVVLQVVDGFDGLEEHGPYDAIHVGAAAPSIPQVLVKQLSKGGRMVIPVGPENGAQEIFMVDKDSDGKVSQQAILGVRYVPLTSKAHQLSRA